MLQGAYSMHSAAEEKEKRSEITKYVKLNMSINLFRADYGHDVSVVYNVT